MYNEYIAIINYYLKPIGCPQILEIGIENGSMTIPLLTDIIKNHTNFSYYGIDIEIRNNIKNFVAANHNINLIQSNSLVEMPKLISKQKKFDVVLIDGDHNYYTVSNELEYASELMTEESILIVDDYHGPWALADYWYGEALDSPQINNPLASKKHDSDKFGVATAICDWLANNQDKEMYSLSVGGFLYKHDENYKLDDDTLGFTHGVMIINKGFNQKILEKYLDMDLVK